MKVGDRVRINTKDYGEFWYGKVGEISEISFSWYGGKEATIICDDVSWITINGGYLEPEETKTKIDDELMEFLMQ